MSIKGIILPHQSLFNDAKCVLMNRVLCQTNFLAENIIVLNQKEHLSITIPRCTDTHNNRREWRITLCCQGNRYFIAYQMLFAGDVIWNREFETLQALMDYVRF